MIPIAGARGKPGRRIPPPVVGQLVVTARQLDALAAYREILAESGPAEMVSLAEAGRRLGIGAGGAYALLRPLADVGLVDRERLRYGPQEGPLDEEPLPEERARIAAELATLAAERKGRAPA